MPEDIDKIIKKANEAWKASVRGTHDEHPDEEIIACFLEGRLSQEDDDRIKLHAASCHLCSERLAVQSRLRVNEDAVVAENHILKAKELVKGPITLTVLEIAVQLKDGLIELLNATGDVLVGQEFIPSPVLRSRNIKDFKNELLVLKDFRDTRVEIKIENKQAKLFNISVAAKEKETQRTLKDLRISLFREGSEIESYHVENGKAVFENVLPGKYTLEIAGTEEKLALIHLEVKI